MSCAYPEFDGRIGRTLSVNNECAAIEELVDELVLQCGDEERKRSNSLAAPKAECVHEDLLRAIAKTMFVYDEQHDYYTLRKEQCVLEESKFRHDLVDVLSVHYAFIRSNIGVFHGNTENQEGALPEAHAFNGHVTALILKVKAHTERLLGDYIYFEYKKRLGMTLSKVVYGSLRKAVAYVHILDKMILREFDFSLYAIVEAINRLQDLGEADTVEYFAEYVEIRQCCLSSIQKASENSEPELFHLYSRYYDLSSFLHFSYKYGFPDYYLTCKSEYAFIPASLFIKQTFAIIRRETAPGTFYGDKADITRGKYMDSLEAFIDCILSERHDVTKCVALSVLFSEMTDPAIARLDLLGVSGVGWLYGLILSKDPSFALAKFTDGSRYFRFKFTDEELGEMRQIRDAGLPAALSLPVYL